jgi:tetratricopeptide (TPR) repeat protein
MSLLLEALKKAEKAKEEAQRRARGESGEPANAPAAQQGSQPAAAPARGGELTLEGHSTPEPEAKRVTTRAELPDISTTLDIASEDLGEKAPPPAREELRLETPREPLRRGTPTFFQAGVQPGRQPPPTQPAAQAAAPQAAERATARKVFEAKFKEPNPKLPFYLTLAALSVFSVGVVVYFWYQLRPPYPLVNTNPQRPSAEAQVAAAQQAPVRPTASSNPAAASSAIPGLPANPPASQPAAPISPAAARPPSAAPVERPILSPAPRLAPPSVNAPQASAPARPTPEVSVSRTAAQVHPRVDMGYAAYQAGDLAKARTDYEQALADEPGNRDALLGLAAIETRSGRFEAAEAQYLRLLQVNPRDSHAQAGLLALRSSRLDPQASESRVKSMLAQDPGSHVLNFTLGNQFAQQGRWAEAQQEYFKAYAGDPENADFAYNLAVSLDHLRQRRLAHDYYVRAAALADKRGASFDPASARLRAGQLAN